MNYFETRLNAGDNTFKELFHRYPYNPILTAKDWPYPVNVVLNPAATFFDNKVLLLARVEDRRGFSHLTKAISDDGISNWTIDRTPTLSSSNEHPEEAWGIEDPRITYIDELKKYAVTYTAYSSCGPVVSLALTDDFVDFERMGPIMPPEDKDAVLFPCRFNSHWILIHRPIEHGAHIWVSCSENLKYWGNHKVLINARGGSWWDGSKVGISAQPLKTDRGWLILYHGVRETASGAIYRLGFALLDLENPLKVLHRSDEWVFGPQEYYEKEGDVRDIVFPCGWLLNPNDNKIKMYYGAADTCIALATASLDEILSYIESCPTPENS
ncbi:glycosidase [Pectinatus frisingensis]|uniref:glycoside hydrolase family 130 protein n=1 Tax=Pectinatus frisingensis TaxID=865 RepID=UPI0015F5C40D|nr:glycosidase [Pectinatus frisingensis]